MKIPGRTLSLLVFVTVGLVQAQTPQANPATPEVAKVDFAALDKDANGKLTKQEVQPVADLEGVFDSLDTDHNGSISSVEFSRWSRAGKATPTPRDPTTAPSGSAGAQHMPKRD
jgi:Ca2+-binding EF-hand superfamily protein